MATLSFNGTTQYTEFSTLTGGLVASVAGDNTCVALVRRTTAGNFHDPFLVTDSTRSTAYAGIKYTNLNALAYDISPPRLPANDGVSHASTTAWLMIASTLAVADTPDAIFHYRDHTASAAWTHTNGNASPGNSAAGTPAASDIIQHGRWETGDFFVGQIALVALWSSKLTNAQFDELIVNSRTSDWWNCSAGNPQHLVEYNVAETSLVDLSGQSTRVAPAAAPTLTGGDPDGAGWTFDGTGTTAAPILAFAFVPVPFIPQAVT